MKFLLPVVEVPSDESLPVRGAWIEIALVRPCGITIPRRSPCGERGLKCVCQQRRLPRVIVAPRAGSVD